MDTSVCLLILPVLLGLVSGRPTAQVLSYYETLNYDPSHLAEQHSRVARDVPEGHEGERAVRLQIEAFNRTFVSSLYHYKTAFAASVKFLVNQRPTTEYDPKTFYRGTLEGEKGSKVIGHIINGIFDGVIRTLNGTYHVEHAHKFFNSPQTFHSIIYHEESVISPHDVPPSYGVEGALLDQLSKVALSHTHPVDTS